MQQEPAQSGVSLRYLAEVCAEANEATTHDSKPDAEQRVDGTAQASMAGVAKGCSDVDSAEARGAEGAHSVLAASVLVADGSNSDDSILSANPEAYMPGDELLARSGKAASGYIGVERNGRKWEARCSIDGVKRNVGSFLGVLQAARARRDFLQTYEGEKAASAPGAPTAKPGRSPVASGRKQKEWFIYGQKALKLKANGGGKMVRVYYRCSYSGCSAKRQIEKNILPDGQEIEVSVIESGVHSHVPQKATPEETHEMVATDSSGYVAARGSVIPKSCIPHPSRDLVLSRNPAYGTIFLQASEHQSILFASPGFLKLTGFSLCEVLGRSMRFNEARADSLDDVQIRYGDIITSARDIVRLASDQVKMAIERRMEIDGVTMLRKKKDGSIYWDRLLMSPVCDSTGKVSLWMMMMLDITKYNEAEKGRKRKHGDPKAGRDIQRSKGAGQGVSRCA